MSEFAVAVVVSIVLLLLAHLAPRNRAIANRLRADKLRTRLERAIVRDLGPDLTAIGRVGAGRRLRVVAIHVSYDEVVVTLVPQAIVDKRKAAGL